MAIVDSNYSQAALETLLTQTRSSDTEVHVLHVIEPVPIYVDGQAWSSIPAQGVVLQEQRKEGEELVQRAAEKLRGAGFKVTTTVEEGIPKVVITDTAAERGVDLIVLGSHGRKGMDRFLMGSVAEAVVRHAPCSVQVARFSRQR